MAKKKWGSKSKPKGNGMTAIIDIDYVKYSVASVAEEVVIKAVYKHKKGVEKEFKNKTEFWGRGKAIGGWLGEQNAEREEKGLEPFSKDDFDIVQVQRRKVELDKDGNELTEEQANANLMYSVKAMIDSALKNSGATDFIAVLGKGESFRVGASTLMEYKGNRKDTLRPLMMDSIVEYIEFKYEPEVVRGIEADDKVVMLSYNQPSCFVVGVDKDMYSQPVKVFNPNRPEEGIIDCNCLGELRLDGSGKVRGYGRKHLLYQMISQDTADNYKFNCASAVKWGEKSAYKALVDCNTDQECWDAVMEVAEKLYPEPISYKTWRGATVHIDKWYVLCEMFNMARMKTSDNDFTTLYDWLDECGINYA